MSTKPLRFLSESPALRRIVAVVAGLLVLGLVVMTLQQASASLHPMPEGLDPFDPADAQAFDEFLQGMPPLAWALVFSSELLGALFGGLTAGWIARDRHRIFSGVIVGLALVGSVTNWMAFPHPVWFIVGQLVGYPLMLMAAWAMLRRDRRQEEPVGTHG
ncbi:MAG: hypothetical protein R3304_07250 [Longimicrobiales bacterium]|nr:hypothetical protein [Longimicrobiales bacterium]